MGDRLKHLVQSVGEGELRAMCLDAARAAHKGARSSSFELFNDFAPPLTKALSQRVGALSGDTYLNQEFLSDLQYPYMAPVLEFSGGWCVRVW
jgi:hypothetical protein